MTDFWLASGLLLLVALSFLLIPVLRGRRAQQEEDRTALNVALYQERVAELQAQGAEGVLNAEQLARGRDEAARELLDDTENAEPLRSARLGKALPILAAFLVPVMAVGLYLHFGASDKVALTQEFATAPQSLEEMTSRLERSVAAQPDNAEGLYFLGRAYMAQERPGDAAKAFERAVGVAGRAPELLGQWAQALYFANNKQWTAQFQALTDEALKADPNEVTSLGLLGIAAFEGERYQEAVDYWNRLLVQLPQGDSSRTALLGGIERAKEKIAAGEGKGSAAVATASAASLTVKVELADALKDKVRPDDVVFIFARAASGPSLPLAARRITVAQLPIEVVLSDSDAMMPNMKLSNFPEVQLMARVSRAGQPGKGEWIGRSSPLPSDTRTPQHLTIDSPDNPDK
ncbi:c-type cytochrome biogenesis protein CcmI [Pseudomonas sp. GD04058]|uniref:c-type cytochrome biogenesis protein CcmI n=1 Tax=Pseudomonas sp. GD04058 TaxID=2975429 RepID=UPI0024488410|nr:c-type cytochrome biogenesis protein CcmI [Pseudomonas sp. GD04058]MDG9882756.1 c-type cytochrome biogenesis protein CcmI [Pseudomonas sp. GD04058]